MAGVVFRTRLWPSCIKQRLQRLKVTANAILLSSTAFNGMHSYQTYHTGARRMVYQELQACFWHAAQQHMHAEMLLKQSPVRFNMAPHIT